jgi:hypothetical protein
MLAFVEIAVISYSDHEIHDIIYHELEIDFIMKISVITLSLFQPWILIVKLILALLASVTLEKLAKTLGKIQFFY